MHRPRALIILTILAALAALTLGAASASAQDLEPYRNYQTMKDDMQQLAEDYEVAQFRILGASTGGLEIFAVDVAANITERSEDELAALPTLYVDGAHHGNEILSAEAAYYALERVLTNTAEDDAYLEGKRLVVNPIVNPDGYLLDQRENLNGVDLNRNYPFHWGLYGTSESPFSGTYRGPDPASETETRTNMALMESLNLYAYLTGHTGTYDIVLPWSADQDGQMPDWPLYEATLTRIEDATGLEYREPSGAGEAHAWAYATQGALGLLPEVSVEQTTPASTEDVEDRLDEILQVYRITWENLAHLGGALHIEEVHDDQLTVHNDGWGAAYNVTAGGETMPTIEPGATVTIPRAQDATQVHYERVMVPTDDPQRKIETVTLQTPDGGDGPPAGAGATGIPAPGIAALLIALTSTAIAKGRGR